MGGGYAKSRENCITIFRGISGITDSCAKPPLIRQNTIENINKRRALHRNKFDAERAILPNVPVYANLPIVKIYYTTIK